MVLCQTVGMIPTLAADHIMVLVDKDGWDIAEPLFVSLVTCAPKSFSFFFFFPSLLHLLEDCGRKG